MKTCDVFSYCGEADILKLRLNILNDYVDEFIICEGDETTAGNPKPRYYEQIRAEKWLTPFIGRIKYHIFSPYTDPALSLLADTSPGVPKDQHWWRREFIQKESMRYALTHLKDDDRVFIGDVDEIWDPTTNFPEGRAELQQTVYTYYLNNKSSEYWTGTSLMRYSDIKKDTLDNLRAYDKAREHMHAPLIQSGWHFTNQIGGEPNFIQRKVQSYAHQEFATPDFLNSIPYRIQNNQDYLGRPFQIGINTENWPEYLKRHQNEYAHLLKPELSQETTSKTAL